MLTALNWKLEKLKRSAEGVSKKSDACDPSRLLTSSQISADANKEGRQPQGDERAESLMLQLTLNSYVIAKPAEKASRAMTVFAMANVSRRACRYGPSIA